MGILKFRLRFILWVYLVIIMLPYSFASKAVSSQDSLESNIVNFMGQNHIPGVAVAIYNNGKITKQVVGYSNVQQKTLVTNDTVFELGSITKTFTGLLLAQKITKGSLHLDDKLSINSMKNTTLLNLATHTSGLPFNISNVPYNAQKLVNNEENLQKFLDTWKDTRAVGKSFLYSNIGFGLLGEEIAKHFKTPYVTLVKSDILEPLQMKKTYFTVPTEAYSSYAMGYDFGGNPTRTPDQGIIPASWALKSSINDMVKYLQLAVGVGVINDNKNNILGAMKVSETPYVELLNTQSKLQVGLGWSVIPLKDSDRVVTFTNAQRLKTKFKENKLANLNYNHLPIKTIMISNPKYNEHALIEKTGSTNGFRAYIATIPDRKVGVIVLANKSLDRNNLIKFGRSILMVRK